MVERVNKIFTEVDWGLSASGKRLVNMGFLIKEIKILDKPSNESDHYNSDFANEDGFFDAPNLLKVS